MKEVKEFIFTTVLPNIYVKYTAITTMTTLLRNSYRFKLNKNLSFIGFRQNFYWPLKLYIICFLLPLYRLIYYFNHTKGRKSGSLIPFLGCISVQARDPVKNPSFAVLRKAAFSRWMWVILRINGLVYRK